jgi:predicted ATPase
MARLDRVPAVREVAQLGAVLGREFAYEILRGLTTIEESALQERLTRLVNAELLYQRGRPPRARYFFKHALIQDAAYESLLRTTRQHYHRQIAQLFENQFPDLVETQPELVAHHYTEAGLNGPAIGWWQRAGERAIQRSAHVEAIRHLTMGLEVVTTLPDTLERARQELALQVALGVPLQATRGWAAPEVEKAYARARELCQQVGDTSQLFPVLFGLWWFYFVRAEYKTARKLTEQLLILAQDIRDSALLLEAHLALGLTLVYLGEFVSAQTHLEQGIALYSPQQHHSLAFRYGSLDPGVICLSYAAFALGLLGYPDQALKKIHEDLSLARELSHPLSLAFALNWAARLHQLRREGRKSQELAETAMTLSNEHMFAQPLAQGTMNCGWALAAQGQVEEGMAQMREGVAAFRATGSEVMLPYYLALLAEMHGKVEEVEEALTLLAEAFALEHKTGEGLYEAELYRLKGELTLQSGAQSWESGAQKEAEACFQRALEVARHQQSKSLELRAATSLSRLWQQQGKRDEAQELLGDTYGWFTEGFDTADLKEAKALLKELST